MPDVPGEKMKVCAKCDSPTIVTDYETIPGMAGRHPYRKCFKCGSRKIKEEIKELKNYLIVKSDHDEIGTSPMQVGERLSQKPKQEEPMDEFFEKHGITFDEYKANKRYKRESPARVLARMKSDKAGPLEYKPDMAVEKAAEDIHALLSEKEKPETKSHAKRLVLDTPMTEITIKVPTSAVQNGITLRVNWTE